ncbi:YEATS domain-containing protein 2-like [Diadema antillarum]|uniref:YEATS domain-containing protein 2-like n=1 Tax=Diadema antillarum TaxID=105358 RepID=UPI003A8A71CF
MATKRRLEMTPSHPDQDPDYEVVTTPTAAKRQRVQEEEAKEQTIRRIQVVIKKQFNIALQNKEKEIELVDERLQKARVQLDRLRACIVARYYGKAGLSSTSGEKSRQKLDLSHPAIQRALGHPSKASSSPPPLQDEETNLSRPPSQVGGASLEESGRSTPIAELLGRSDAFSDLDGNGFSPGPKGPRNLGQDTFGVGPPLDHIKHHTALMEASEGSRFHVKKRIIVGNVSKYIPPGHREDSDPSTHKWMVYVRGPPDEPRIDHFVEKVWFFLHPSYRPNDLLEVKEPPFHLTRRGWGEFPIRIQLHFKDIRNKKVDIIHHLKLDRTYTGLQTLGAETIVDVELDRYLYSETGDPLSRPSTPTVTKVNYKEGLRPALSRVPTPIRNTISLNDDSRRQSITSPSPQLLESFGKTPDSTPERSRTPSQGSAASSPLLKSLPGSSGATPMSITLDGCLDSFKEEAGDLGPSAAVSLGKLSLKVKAQSGPALLNQGKPVRTMPPLGPISTPINSKTPSLDPPTTQVSPTGLDSVSFSPSLLVNSGSSSLGTLLSDGQTVSPTQTGAINVGDIAISSQGGNLIRIQDGQIVQELPSDAVSPTHAKAEMKTVVTLNQVMSGSKSIIKASQASSPPGTNTPSISLQKISVPSASSHPQAMVGTSTPAMPSTVSISQLSKQPLVASPVVRKSPSGVTLVQQTAVGVSASRVGQQANVMPVIPNPPPGTQYYVTAKSTDKNLQGKVILIPQQVFSQNSGQSGKSGRGAGKTSNTSKQGSGSFLSPSNVLILPQGSIVPPLPPGSIVQIQPVPTPTRSSSQSSGSAQQMTRIALTQKSGASTIITPKPATQRLASGGGVIQIQRSAGQTLAKLVPALGAPTQQATSSPSSSVSLIPEMKGQLARTPAGGVVLVQRSSANSKSNTVQTLSGLPSVVATQTVPVAQKIAINQITGSNIIPAQQKVSLPLKGGNSVLLPQATKLSSSRTVVLQPTAPSPSTNSMKTIQVRREQPAVKTVTKIVPPMNDLEKTCEKMKSCAAKNVKEDKVKDAGELDLLSEAVTERTKPSVGKDEEPGTENKPNHVKQVSNDNGLLKESTEKKECTSSKSLSCQEDVQNVESMQASTGAVCSNEEAMDDSDTVHQVVEDSTSALKGLKTLKDVSSHCDVEIKKELEEEIPVAESMEVDDGLIQNGSSVNGHCVIPKSVVTANVADRRNKTSRTEDGNVTVSELSMKPKAAVSNKCVIKVVNAKLKGSTGCQDASQPSQRRVRVIRIKQEPGTEPILAALATAPILSPSQEMKDGLEATGGRRVEAGPAQDGWESRELKDWMKVLGEHFEEETNLYGVTSIEQLMKYVAEQAPLIDSTRVQNELPFCATSLDHYHSWPLPKRRAMEWQRAVFMHGKVARLKAKVARLSDVPMWSKKKIMIWCRRHGFTPQEPGVKEKEVNVSCSLCGQKGCRNPGLGRSDQATGCLREWLSPSGILKQTTFCTAEDLSQRVYESQCELGSSQDSDSDIEIDVISYGDPAKRLKIKTEGDEKLQLKCFMPPSEGARYVQDAAQKIGVHLNPVQVCEDTFSPVIQEMIFVATRQFLSDVVRGALAKSYGGREDCRLPDEILPLHVHQSVASMQSCDFLTNKHLGVAATASHTATESQ